MSNQRFSVYSIKRAKLVVYRLMTSIFIQKRRCLRTLCRWFVWGGILVVLSGCQWFSTERSIRIIPPDIPDVLSSLVSGVDWVLEYRDERGFTLTREVSGSFFYLSGIPRNRNGFVLLYPEGHFSVDFFLPAGGWVPDDRDLIELTWESGSAGVLFQKYVQRAGSAGGINWDRIDQELKIRFPENPWCIKRDEILVELASGNFTVTDLSARTEVDFLLTLPRGHWVSSNVFRDPLVIDGDDSVVVKLPVGTSRYRDPANPGRELILECQDGEVGVFVIE